LELRKREVGEYSSEDEIIFCNKDGSPIKSFKKSFSSLFIGAGIEMGKNGQKRTIYSLRHTYATFF
jgi:integrase